MRKLQLLGAEWLETQGVFGLAPGQQVPLLPSTSVRLIRDHKQQDWLDANLAIQWPSGYLIKLHVQIPCKLVQNQWRLLSTPNAAVRNLHVTYHQSPADALWLEVGAVNVHSSAPRLLVEQQEITFLTCVSQSVWLRPERFEHPLTLISSLAACRINLIQPELTFLPRAFQAKLDCVCHTELTGMRSVHDQLFVSTKYSVGLARVDVRTAILFETRSRVFLNFEVDSRQHYVGQTLRNSQPSSERIVVSQPNSVVPSIEAVDYLLGVDLERPDNWPPHMGPQVAALRLLAKSAQSYLICHGAIDEQDKPVRLPCERVELMVRIGSPSIRNNLNLGCCMVASAKVRTADLSLELHGLTPGTWARLRGATELNIVGRRHLDAGLVASLLVREPGSLPLVAQLSDHLVCYDALTVLERSVQADDQIQAQAEVSLKELTAGLGDTTIQPITFTGGKLQIPMVDVDRLRHWNWALSTQELFKVPYSEFEELRPSLAQTIFPERLRSRFHQSGLTLSNELSVTMRSHDQAWTLSDIGTGQDFLAFASTAGLHVCVAAENPLRDLLEQVNIQQGSALGPRAMASTKLHASRVEVGAGAQQTRTLSEIVIREPAGFRGQQIEQASRDGNDAGAPSESELRQVFDDHTAVLNFNNVELALPVPRDGMPENPVPNLQGLVRKADFSDFIPHRIADGISSWFRVPFDVPDVDQVDGFNYVVGLQQTLAILKLQSGIGLQDVVDRLPKGERGPKWYVQQLVEGGRDQFGSLQPGNQIDGDVLSPGWTGVIVFNPGMLIEVPGLNTLLSKFVGMPMRYLAFSAHIDEDKVHRDYSNVYGTYRYVDDGAGEIGPDEELDTDVIWDLGAVDVRFRDREIVHFEVTGFLLIRKFWKTEAPADTQTHEFKVVGRYQSASAEGNPTGAPRIVFEATSKTPLVMKLGEHGLAFLKAVHFKGVTVYLEGLGTDGKSQQGSRFELDGEIETQKWDGGPDFLQVDPDKFIKFSHLGLPLPGNGRMKWDWPSLEFPLKQKQPLRLGSIEFSFTGIGIGRADLFKGMLKIFGDEPAGTFPWVSVKVELFKYPQLSEKAGQSLGLELLTAIQDDGGTGGLWLKGLDFDNLDIDLFRFLRIRARKVKLFGGQQQAALLIYQMTLEILGKEIIGSKNDPESGLTALLFQDTQNKEQRGFLAYLHEKISIHPVVEIDWLLLANGANLGKVAPLLLSLNETGSEDLLKTILEQCEKREIGGSAVNGRWGFGIGFAILGENSSLRAKMLFMDGSVYGLMVQSEILKQWLGFEGFAIAYIKGDTPERDHFWLEIQVPWFTAGALNFLGGVIAFEVYLNGGFMTDFGFPWLKDGIRRWDRGLGFNVGIYVGHAGAYFRYLPGKSANGNSEITVAGGFGLAVGYGWGGEFAEGRLKVYVGIEVYGIVEGVIVIEAGSGLNILGHSGSTALAAPNTGLAVASRGLTLSSARLTGIVGIVVRGYGEIDVWILYAKIEVIAFAEAETTLTWAKHERAKLIYVFRIGQRFSASCRVGKGWFSWTFRFETQATMEIGGSIDL